MNVLIVGAKSTFMESMIDKLHKEGHRIYALTGSKFAKYKLKKVFEQYNFPYDSDMMPEIIESIQPKLIVFMGAYDIALFSRSEGGNAISYSAGVLNILNAAKRIKNVKAVFISSQEVYVGHFPDNIKEDKTINNTDVRAVAIAQAETATLGFGTDGGMDTLVLRVDHMCVPPKMSKDITECVGSMCVDYIKNDSVYTTSRNDVFSVISMKDAIQFIYTAIAAPTHKQSIYHISSSMEINEEEITKIIYARIGRKEYTINTEKEGGHRLILDNSAFMEEFGGKIFKNPEQTVEEVADAVIANKAELIETEDTPQTFWQKVMFHARYVFRALLPFIENVLIFLPVFMLNNRAVDSEYFSYVDIYLLYVIGFAVAYGQQQATFSALLATAGFIFRYAYGKTGLDVALDYNTYVWIAQVFAIGLIVGHMRDRIKNLQSESLNEEIYLKEQIDDIADINTSNVFIKNVLETQIINQDNSLGKVYEITSTLDSYEPEEVLFYATQIISELIGSPDVAIYSVANGDYARLYAATSEKARSLGNSIEYRKMTDVYADISNKRVFINRSLDERYPRMADAIYSEDKMQLIVMVWGLQWELMNQGQANMLHVAGFLIQNAVVRANKYMAALEEQRYVSGTHLLDSDAFKSLLKAYVTARDKGLTQCCVLAIEAPLDKVEEAGTALVKKLRTSDFLGIYEGNLYALLSNTDKDDASFVINRFDEVGYKSKIEEDIVI